MKYYLVTLLFCGIILCGTVTILSTAQSPVEENGNVSKEEGIGNGDCVFNVTKNGVLSANGTVKPSEECVWTIFGNDSLIGSSGLMFEKVHLDDSDNITVEINGTVIFGPYHGALDPLVIVVDEKNFTVKLSTSANKIIRAFQVMYSENCIFSIPPALEIIQSPIYKEKDKLISCTYDYNKIHADVSYSFIFKNFSLDSKSNLDVTKADGPLGTYGVTPPDIFGSLARFNMTLNANFSGNTLTILRRDLYHSCSGFIKLPTTSVPVLRSPIALKSYNDTTKFECRWLIKSEDANSVLGLLVDKLQFSDVFDMLIVNDGPSEVSPPIVQATFINQNETKAKVIRSSGPYMWISFRSEGFTSNFSGNYTKGQGGYHRGSGNISLLSGSDAVFLLEVPQDEKVLLKFSLTTFTSPATLSVYDGFSKTSSLIAQLSENIWYPVVSSTSKMMITASNFGNSKFSAAFSGIKSDCIHMSASSNDAYVLSGNCNSSCAWIVPPKNISEGVLLLGFQFLSLDVSDVVKVFRLGNSTTSIATILHSTKHVPPLTFSPKEGFLVNITRGGCSSEDVVLVARSTYLPGCSGKFSLMPSSELQLSSPNYPNMYPLFASCQWDLNASGNTTQFYLSFNSMKLAPNHCVRITQGNTTKPEVFSGNELPNDMLFRNVTVQFDSFSCNKSDIATSLASDEGFVLDVTGSDCGKIMSAKTGHFNTNLTTSKEKSACFWIIEVPYNETDGSVNSIMFTVDESGQKGNNSEFHVYDGPSVRDSLMTNLTGNAWSRSNTVIFVYKRFNSSAPSALYSVTYKTISCNKTMQCQNGICLHPDWLCNGDNDCGDFTDERNCETVPVPDSIKESNGVSPLAFGLVTVLFFGLGALAAFLIPKAINRYRNGRYHQFQDYSGVD